MKLKDKTALITGGSKGIGKGIAKAFLKEGAIVIICGRNERDLKRTRDDLSKYGNISYIKADISKRNQVKSLKNKIERMFGKLDVLVNNASVLGLRKPIMDYDEDIWQETIHINLNAQFFVTKALLPLLMNANNPSIINVSSSVGRRGKGGWGAYAASKFGLEGLTQVLADELKSNVRVNSVNPGGTRTEMRAEAYPEEDPETLPTPDDIAPIFVYLASDDSISVTGEAFNARDWMREQQSMQ
ncbi:MAG TPA: SDR family NAD(P)-dependent oxidoreductase [Thermodesulfobacteriota bacterium]